MNSFRKFYLVLKPLRHTYISFRDKDMPTKPDKFGDYHRNFNFPQFICPSVIGKVLTFLVLNCKSPIVLPRIRVSSLYLKNKNNNIYLLVQEKIELLNTQSYTNFIITECSIVVLQTHYKPSPNCQKSIKPLIHYPAILNL